MGSAARPFALHLDLPQGDADFSLRWSTIKRLVSKQCGQEYGIKDVSPSRAKRHESGLWQRRFWEHQIRDDHDFSRHVDYIHWNPVKHGLASRAIDWPYSTFPRFVEDGVYSSDWGLGGANLRGIAGDERCDDGARGAPYEFGYLN